MIICEKIVFVAFQLRVAAGCGQIECTHNARAAKSHSFGELNYTHPIHDSIG